MTNEELDEARVKEGRRIVQDRHPAHIPQVTEVAREAARLAREGWTPPETVSDDLLAAREWCAMNSLAPDPHMYRIGKNDEWLFTRAYLAGCTRGREGAMDNEKLQPCPPPNKRCEHCGAEVGQMCLARDALASAKRGG